MSQPSTELGHTNDPAEADRIVVRETFYQIPILERGRPIFLEMLWVLLGHQNPEQHKNLLPDYCYNILKIFRNTYFKGFPLLSDIISVADQTQLSVAKSVDEAKKVVRLDWKNLGRVLGIGVRCIRFTQMEAEDGLDGEGFGHWEPDRTKMLFTVIFGKKWADENSARILAESPDKLLAEMLNQHLAKWLGGIPVMMSKFDSLAYQWSPEAMAEFHAGYTEGLNSFLDENGRLAGGSNRSGIYGFLLFAWPEIKVMLESEQKKTLSDLHEWMEPFMRTGNVTQIDIETLRDVCAPPSQSGIGLSLRPLKSRH